MQYVHFPKTGSTFALAVWAHACHIAPPADLFDHLITPNSSHRGRTITMQQPATVYRAWLEAIDAQGEPRACPRLLQNGNLLQSAKAVDSQYHHQPLHNEAAARTAVAMLRHPFARALSHWRYVPGGQHGQCPTAHDLYLLRDGWDRQRTIGCIAGCQCKMLLGRSCLACRNRTLHSQNAGLMRVDPTFKLALEPPVSASDVTECVRRLHLLRFVGLTDRFNESVALFCARHGCPHWALQPAQRVTRESVASKVPCKPPDGWRDDADAAVYEAARIIFERGQHSQLAKKAEGTRET